MLGRGRGFEEIKEDLDDVVARVKTSGLWDGWRLLIGCTDEIKADVELASLESWPHRDPIQVIPEICHLWRDIIMSFENADGREVVSARIDN